ncbi:MAG: N-acetylmuramoyl-L-alanine amidase, partial [Gammaproteobacteria bacterium]|nr:N-acetylmuramoyl-L-alanine amidase [Gammaproteobacteria bacterium]
MLLDSGHGGYDPGVIVEGVREKDIVLDYVLRIGQVL